MVAASGYSVNRALSTTGEILRVVLVFELQGEAALILV